MRSPEELQQSDTVDFLNKCWMTHDGMWFFHCLQTIGIEKTNALNKSAIKSLASVEIPRIKQILDCEAPEEDFPTFKSFFAKASHLIIPDFMNVTVDFPKHNQMAWAFNPGKCFAYTGVKRMGVIDAYECGVLYRIHCWLDELGITHRFSPEIGGCHMHRTGTCSGNIQLNF